MILFLGYSGYIEKFVDGRAIRKYHITHFQNGRHEIVANISGNTFYQEVKAISWTGGQRPSDTPKCGFTGDHCKDESKFLQNSPR